MTNNNYMACDKEKFVLEICSSDSQINRALNELGMYGEYSYLNFYPHLYDVYIKSLWLINHLNASLRPIIDLLIIRDLAITHDAGKVISVLLWRAFRVLKLKLQYPNGIKNESLLTYDDVNLLGFREHLLNGWKIEKVNILGKYPCLENYMDLLNDLDKIPPRDVNLTLEIIDKIRHSVHNKEEELRWNKIRDIISINTSDIDICKNDENILYAVVLDLADKLADYDLTDVNSFIDIKQLLTKKRDYVIRRYVTEYPSTLNSVEIEFTKSYELFDKLFILQPSS